MGKQITENKKEKTEAGFAVNENAFYRRRCNMNVSGVKSKC